MYVPKRNKKIQHLGHWVSSLKLKALLWAEALSGGSWATRAGAAQSAFPTLHPSP
ncbi:hypothetical protein I79_016783 [Cricetulus griseus]|uniref:Uncharacterized protein n=1 Tax=Cricetulus griseus TaxID=10029 RepID=G3I0A6_CRIGR|nr:hypothetical protein I79_016783 [Cricetulus griseus]